MGREQRQAFTEWREMVRKAYQARIPVHKPWREKVANFYQDMGAPPAGAKLVRRNESGDFTPDNCEWAV